MVPPSYKFSPLLVSPTYQKQRYLCKFGDNTLIMHQISSFVHHPANRQSNSFQS